MGDFIEIRAPSNNEEFSIWPKTPTEGPNTLLRWILESWRKARLILSESETLELPWLALEGKIKGIPKKIS